MGAPAFEWHSYRGDVVRIVEGQHLISTNRLADNPADQALLEQLGDTVKPSLPPNAQHLPWLLAAPFRYGYGRPSRFRAPTERHGIFYASEDIETAVTEAAYWRLMGFSRSPDMIRPKSPTTMSAFTTGVKSDAALDLTIPPLSARQAEWTHPSDYTATNALARQARSAGADMVRAPSARHAGGINVAVFAPSALIPPPRTHSSWAFLATTTGLLASQELGNAMLRFTPQQFGLPPLS